MTRPGAPSFFSRPLRKEGGDFDFPCRESEPRWTDATAACPKGFEREETEQRRQHRYPPCSNFRNISSFRSSFADLGL
jgi:hypothetical protein